jgi:tRNA (guanine-N7-)-methyltransferase
MGTNRSCRRSESRFDLTGLLAPDPHKNKQILYGRRQGRPLRKAQRARISDFLPQISIESLESLDQPHALFDPPVKVIWLEVGFGGGEHLAAQAQAHTEIGFIGCEPFINGVAGLVRTVEIADIKNVRVYTGDARSLIDALPDRSIERCFILFPDPWPKRRHHRRRIISPETLTELSRVMVDNARLRLASDHREYVRWMLSHTLRNGAFEWCAKGPDDWRTRPHDWPATRYEKKAAQRGETSIYLEFNRRARVDK